MKTRRIRWNRRKEARHHCDYKSILWSRDGRMNPNRGWLNDQSWSGLSFVAPQTDGLTPGDDIEIIAANRSDKTSCRVVRVEELGQSRNLIGCKKDVPGNILISRRPRRKIIEKSCDSIKKESQSSSRQQINIVQ